MDEVQGQELLIGGRVVEKVSGYTGEIYQLFPWGVQVWVPDHGNARENWSWSMITERHPRLIKRYPRPFRYPRLVPSLQCHCQIGRMEVQGENKVLCLRCKKLIGDTAFPKRYRRASELLRKTYSGTKSKSKASTGVARPKRTTPRKSKRKAKVPRGVGVRYARGRKEKPNRGTPSSRKKKPHHKVSPKARRRSHPVSKKARNKK